MQCPCLKWQVWARSSSSRSCNVHPLRALSTPSIMNKGCRPSPCLWVKIQNHVSPHGRGHGLWLLRMLKKTHTSLSVVLTAFPRNIEILYTFMISTYHPCALFSHFLLVNKAFFGALDVECRFHERSTFAFEGLKNGLVCEMRALTLLKFFRSICVKSQEVPSTSLDDQNVRCVSKTIIGLLFEAIFPPKQGRHRRHPPLMLFH